MFNENNQLFTAVLCGGVEGQAEQEAKGKKL